MQALPSLEHSIRPIHIRPTAELAERVLLPGDPHRALAVATSLLEGPLMFNHTRGLWGYSGKAPDGEPLTIQATGMGGPSTAIVCEELIALGARRLVRIGTCGALGDDLELGELVAAEWVLGADGTSAALGADGLMKPDPEMTAALVAAGTTPATVVSTDLFYDPRPDQGWVERGVAVVEMEAATILRVASLRGAAAACVCAVSDVPGKDGSERIEPAQLEEAATKLGQAGFAAVAN